MKVVNGRELMGRNEYQRHRNLDSPNAVTKAEQSGRIAGAVIRDETGTFIGIDWRLADELWERNTDPGAAEKSGTIPDIPVSAVSGAEGCTDAAHGNERRTPGNPDGQLELPGDDSNTEKSYLEHRAKTEKFRSMQAELDYLQALKLLVPVGQFREATFRRYRSLRDKLLNIPDRVATVLAAERDPVQIHHKLTEEIRRVLSELSDDARAELARGVAERVAA